MEKLLDERINGRLMTLRILYGAMLTSSGIFFFLAMNAPAAIVPEGDIILPVLAVVSVVVLIVSEVFPSTVEKKALAGLSAAMTDREVNDESVPTSFAKHNTTRAFADPKKALGAALDATFTPFVMRMALRESVAIYGLLLAYLGHPFGQCLPFLAIAFVAQALAFPSLPRIANLLEKQKGGSLGPRT